MSIPDVADFWFDDDNESKFAAHGLTPRHVFQVLQNRHIVVRNRRGRRAEYRVIGRDNGGVCLTVPIERTRERDVWRPITAWVSKDYERQWLERRQ